MKLKEEIENSPNKYIFNYAVFKDFIESVKETNDQWTVAGDYTEDIEALLEMIKALYPFLAHRKMKTRFTKFHAKIRSQKAENNSDSHPPKQNIYVAQISSYKTEMFGIHKALTLMQESTTYNQFSTYSVSPRVIHSIQLLNQKIKSPYMT